MYITAEPDLTIPFPDTDAPLKDFVEKVNAACNTIELLHLDTAPTEENVREAEQALYTYAEAAPSSAKKLLTQSNKYQPATYHEVKALLDEYSVRVVESAVQIRLLVTNKLILESENQDPRIRIRALELLGKITDVGLFTEKSEVTVTHRSTEDLVTSIRSKLNKLMAPQTIEGEVLAVNGETIDLDAELGVPEVGMHTPEEEALFE